MTETEPSRDAKQKVLVEQAREHANNSRKFQFIEGARLFDDLADEIERLQKDVDTFRKLEGA